MHSLKKSIVFLIIFLCLASPIFKLKMSLFDSFQEVKSKIIPDDPVVIDGFVFRLHYVYTVTLLLAFSGLLSLSQVRRI